MKIAINPDGPLGRRADCVLLDVRVYEKHLQAGNMAKLLAPAERDAATSRTRSARGFLREFKRVHKIPG